MSYKSKEDQARAARRHYEKNHQLVKDRARAFNLKRGLEIRAIVVKLKTNPCTDCGDIFPPCAMDFDHIRGTKSFDIGSASTQGVSIKRLEAEIAKCELVCANCHRIRTHTRSVT